MLKEKFHPNVKGWRANENDYVLMFMPDKQGMWRELGHEIPKYNNILFADYLSELAINVPDYTQFLRIISDEFLFEYRAYDVNRVVIRFQKNLFK